MPSSMAQSRPAYVPPGGGSKPTAQKAAVSPAAQKPATQRAAAPATAQRAASPATAKAETFSQAFAKARAAKQGTFTWNGKQYTTQLKGESTAKPQATQTKETPPPKIPSKVLTSVSRPYFESPTGVMQPASVKTAEMLGARIQKMPARHATSVQASPPTAQSTQYFKPGTMAEYLEERRRKMQGNLMTKR